MVNKSKQFRTASLSPQLACLVGWGDFAGLELARLSVSQYFKECVGQEMLTIFGRGILRVHFSMDLGSIGHLLQEHASPEQTYTCIARVKYACGVNVYICLPFTIT